MSKKKSALDILEAQLDKIVLGLIGIISLYLIWTLVLGNPYGVTVGGRKLAPGQIDQRNRQQAQHLLQSLDEPAEPMAYDMRLTSEFDTLMRSPISGIAWQTPIPIPGAGEQIIDEERIYPAPEIIPISDVQIASIRGAVHRPIEDVGPDSPYSSIATELGDLDLITVSGRIDLSTLFRNFQQSFMGPRLNAAWREPSFARPVFARIQLQRRAQRGDNNWSDWQDVPPSRIHPYRRLIEQTPMTVDEMAFGGVMMWLKQYEDMRIQSTLLQPVNYDFASLPTMWLPPHYWQEAETILQRQEEERRRQQREERLRARETATRPGQRQAPGQMPGMMPGPGMPGPGAPDQTRRRAERRERTLDDLHRDMQREQITEQTRLDALREPALVWAHDDTAQPGKTYQYRIRFGVFNPIAGRNWFREDQAHLKEQTVFWSDFSEPTKVVAVPKMLHLFPTDVLAQAGTGGVKVDVARYYLGRWHTQEFDVYAGQIIGDEAERIDDTDDRRTTGGAAPTGAEAELFKTVDFTTPYMMVDVNTHVDWSAAFNRTEFSQMLYFGPDEAMLTMPIGTRNWPSQINRDYRAIKEAEQNPVPLNMTRTTSPGTFQRDGGTPGGMPGMPGMPDMFF